MWVVLEELVGNSTAIERAINGEELSFDDGMEILDDDNLHVIGAAADIVRKKLVGDTVSFAASYYMNYTNLCAASCQMCAFYRKGDEDDAYTLSPDQIEKRVAAAKDLGATEVTVYDCAPPSPRCCTMWNTLGLQSQFQVF